MFSGVIYIIIVSEFTMYLSSNLIDRGYETPDEQILKKTIPLPGAPLRPTQDPMVVRDRGFDLNGSPTNVIPLKSDKPPGAPIKRTRKSNRSSGVFVAVCQRRRPSMFLPSVFHPSGFLTDFGSHASPLKTAKLYDEKRPPPETPVKSRPSLF